MPVSPARASAFEALLRIERTDAYASELLHSSRYAKLSRVDHHLLTELTLGVLRWRSALDSAIAQSLGAPAAKLDLEVLTSLRLGVYQLLFLQRVPAHAAINESVELTKRARKRSAAGLVNAVLRKISSAGNSATLSAAAAHPAWLAERWPANYGADIALLICAYDQRPPATTIRMSGNTVLPELERAGIQTKPGRFVRGAYTVISGDVTATRAFRERRMTIQDEASQLVALLAGQGSSFLDCCAAPGGKARMIAQRNPAAQVVALELHPHRAALLRKMVPEVNVRVLAADVRSIPLNKKFGCVLVDAPCSGTGTLARNPEIKWRLKPDDLVRLQRYQAEILLSAMQQVASGGRIVYSTCSLEPEENERVVEKALSSDPSFSLLDCGAELQKLQESGELQLEEFDSLLSGLDLRTLPGLHGCDGFFAAIIAKR